MTTRLANLCFDANNPVRLARFWASALGWEIYDETHDEVGVLPRLVHSRFGLHVVEVLERETGVDKPFEAVRGVVQMALRQKAYVTALRQYLQVLAGAADVQGVALDSAGSPLVQ